MWPSDRPRWLALMRCMCGPWGRWDWQGLGGFGRLGLLAMAFMGLVVSAPAAAQQDRDSLVLIGHAQVPRIDLFTAQRLYTGRVIELGGLAISVVNLPPGTKLRERFLQQVLNQDDDRYLAYWTVRRHIGKGTPPRELKSVAEVLDFVQTTPGAVGYVTQGDLKAGINVILRP